MGLKRGFDTAYAEVCLDSMYNSQPARDYGRKIVGAILDQKSHHGIEIRIRLTMRE